MPDETLIVVEGPAAGSEIQLGNTLEIGREADLDGHLGGDPELSRRHARFSRDEEGRIVVEDLGSMNGTYVNGERIDAPRALAGGDRVSFGKSVLELLVPLPPPQMTMMADALPPPLVQDTVPGTVPVVTTAEAPVEHPPTGAPYVDLGLTGKRAIVTGVSGPVGQACALALARQGVAVAAVDSSPGETTAGLAQQLQELGGPSYLVQADVVSEADVAQLVSDAVSRFGDIDVFVGCEAVGGGAAPGLALDEWRSTLDANLTGHFLVVRRVLDAMPATGSIVTIGSSAPPAGPDGGLIQATSKAGMAGFTEALSEQVRSRGIRANLVLAAAVGPAPDATLGPDEIAAGEELAALRLRRQTDEIAGIVLFLASDLSRFISGQTLTVHAAA